MRLPRPAWFTRYKNRKQFMRTDFPYAYGISLGEWNCNRLCRMCPMFVKLPAEQKFMTPEVFERACNQVGDRKINIELSAYGETFQHPLADEFMFASRKLCPNAEIVIATNGTLLDRERCIKIVESGIDHLSFSLDAGSVESYKWLTGAGDYKRVCGNLETLAEIKAQRGADHLKITTHIIGLKELSHEFEPFVHKWENIVDSACVRPYGNWGGLVDNNGVTPSEELFVPAERYPCTWLWYATKIEPNGDVSKCMIHVTGDYGSVGNIMNQSFESIWQGDAMNRLRELHCSNRYDEMEFCANCTVWALFPNMWKKHRASGGNVWK